jgi:hypothetical protein
MPTTRDGGEFVLDASTAGSLVFSCCESGLRLSGSGGCPHARAVVGVDAEHLISGDGGTNTSGAAWAPSLLS